MALRASKKLRTDEAMVAALGSTVLRKHLDDVPLWRGDHVPVRQLVADFATYLYLPRLAGPEVLIKAMRDGIALLTWQTDTFAYAESYDEATGRYRGLFHGHGVNLSADSAGLLVKPDVAKRQIDAEVAPVPPMPGPGTTPDPSPGHGGIGPGPVVTQAPTAPLPWHGHPGPGAGRP